MVYDIAIPTLVTSLPNSDLKDEWRVTPSSGYPTQFLPAASAGNGHARAAQAARFFGQASSTRESHMENPWESIPDWGLNSKSVARCRLDG